MMINKDKFFKIALVIAIILLVVLVYLSFIDKAKAIKNPYYAVYLRTGDMYFGKISKFPKFTLSDVWFLQANLNEQGGFNLTEFDKAIFGPSDEIEINKDDIVWISKLRDESEVVKYIQGDITGVTPQVETPQTQAPQTEMPQNESLQGEMPEE
ncbi:MAG: hypothetical protein WC283_00465 [Candidatus Paceibacterota bacterium]|jgi:hypothetical protein